jgi:hypothetical protein
MRVSFDYTILDTTLKMDTSILNRDPLIAYIKKLTSRAGNLVKEIITVVPLDYILFPVKISDPPKTMCGASTN